jgi:hypothetical protein
MRIEASGSKRLFGNVESGVRPSFCEQKEAKKL